MLEVNYTSKANSKEKKTRLVAGSPKGQSYGWEAGLRGIQGSKISGHLQSPTHPLPKVWQWGAGSLSFHEVGGRGDAF